MKRFLSSLLVVTLVTGLCAPIVSAQVEPAPPPLSDQIDHEADTAGQLASGALHQAGQNLKQAAIYLGKTIVNGCEFIIFKTAQGTFLVVAATVRGIEYAVEGAKFVLVMAKEGVIWVAEQAILAGEILVDLTCQAAQYVVDGVVYVAVQVAEGVVFVAQETLELAKKTGELIIKGVKYVIKKTEEGIIWVAQKTATLSRRAALASELRMNITGALAVGGVGTRTLEYFNSRSQDRDPVIARLGKACLGASEAFNAAYYSTK